MPLHIVKTANATLGHYGEIKAAPLTLDRASCMPTFAPPEALMSSVHPLRSHRRDGGWPVMGLLTELRGDVETPYLEYMYMWCNWVYWSYLSNEYCGVPRRSREGYGFFD